MPEYKATHSVIEAVRQALADGRQLAAGRVLAGELDSGGATTVDLEKIAEQADTSLRTIRYAVQTYRFATRVGLSESDMERIGWTKLAVVTSGASDDMTKEDVIAMCEGRTVTELRAVVAGIAGSVKVVTFSLNKSQRRELEAALIRHGAVRVGRGLTGKEAALMKIVSGGE
ncbi:MAG: hypothetical protein AAB403_12280 [Planctomycetota bacterium]